MPKILELKQERGGGGKWLKIIKEGNIHQQTLLGVAGRGGGGAGGGVGVLRSPESPGAVLGDLAGRLLALEVPKKKKKKR